MAKGPGIWAAIWLPPYLLRVIISVMKGKNIFGAFLGILLLVTVLYFFSSPRKTEDEVKEGPEVARTVEEADVPAVDKQVSPKKRKPKVDPIQAPPLKVGRAVVPAGDIEELKKRMGRMEGERARRILRSDLRGYLERKKLPGKERRIIKIGNERVEITGDFFGIKSQDYNASMGRKVKEVNGGYTIFASPDSPENPEVKTVARKLNGGRLGVLTGNMLITYKDLGSRGEIENKYNLEAGKEFVELKMINYYEEDLDVLLAKYERLVQEESVERVVPEILDSLLKID